MGEEWGGDQVWGEIRKKLERDRSGEGKERAGKENRNWWGGSSWSGGDSWESWGITITVTPNSGGYGT